MIEGFGEVGAEMLSDINFPVDISLTEIDDEEYKFSLRASVYMPITGEVAENVVDIRADNREGLVKLLEKYMIPLYEKELEKLKKIAKGEDY